MSNYASILFGCPLPHQLTKQILPPHVKSGKEELEILRVAQGSQHIVTLYSWSENTTITLVMEWAQTDLGRLDLIHPPGDFAWCMPDARGALAQLSRALVHLADKQIVHADIKPENVLLKRNGVLCLCDFGNSFFTNRPKDGHLITTHPYRAPEVALHHHINTLLRRKSTKESVARGLRDSLVSFVDFHYSRAVDYWSLGVTLQAIYYTGGRFNPLEAFPKGHMEVMHDPRDSTNEILLVHILEHFQCSEDDLYHSPFSAALFACFELGGILSEDLGTEALLGQCRTPHGEIDNELLVLLLLDPIKRLRQGDDLVNHFVYNA